MTQSSLPFLTDRLGDALSNASRLHPAQQRQDAAIPYVSHLLAVAAVALENGADEEIGAGWRQLQAIGTHFGDDVAAIGADCTSSHEDTKPEWQPRKYAYIASLAHKPARSLAVNLADKAHNASAHQCPFAPARQQRLGTLQRAPGREIMVLPCARRCICMPRTRPGRRSFHARGG